METKTHVKKLTTAIRAAALLGVGSVCIPAQALEYQFDEFLLNVDTTLGYSAQWRTESRDKDLEAEINSNDGNLNFDSGSMTSSKANFILEVGGEYRDFSFFVRADGLYDYIYADSSSDLSAENYPMYNGGFPAGGTVARGDYPRETVDEHGRRVRLLDAFATYNFDIGSQSGSIKAGRQVIMWGGTAFYPGINGLQNHSDGAVASSPGTELKEIFLPNSAIDLKWDFNASFSAEAFYKLEWNETIQPGVGSYMSTSDSTGPGAQRVFLGSDPSAPTAPTGRKIKPEDDDQWGLALRYINNRGDTLELAYVEAHSNLPAGRFAVSPSPILNELYSEDIPAWNLSYSALVSEAEVTVDLMYSDDMPFVDRNFQVADNGDFLAATASRGHYYQAVVGMTDVYSAFKWLSPSIAVRAEMFYSGNNLGGSTVGDNGYLATDDTWGYQFTVTPRYYNVLPGLDGSVTLFFKHDVSGYGNAIAVGNGLKEDQKSARLIVMGDYLTNWSFQAQYIWFWDDDGDQLNLVEDRDNFSIGVKYRF